MLRFAKKTIRRMANRFGYDFVPLSLGTSQTNPDFPSDFDDATVNICRTVKPFTMTSYERVFSLCRAVEYVVQHNIPGDIVECGVWKGGSMMATALTLARLGARRKLHLYDTFEGMSAPTEADVSIGGEVASSALAGADKETGMIWAYSPLEEVKRNLQATGYDQGQVAFIKGKVEDTIPGQVPEKIALLRLDTDWYESTYHELVHLYPRLSVGGVLIIDDYGHWQGQRKAVDQYFAERNVKLLLNRIDYTGRIGVKLEA